MSNVKKISIALTSDMLQSVRGAVDAGDYASTSEVVREALRDWRERQAEKQAVAAVRALVAEGDASGYEPYTGMDALKRRGRADRLPSA